MKIVLLGPPGCGKGTQGVRLSEKYNLPQLSTGEILRRAIAEGTSLGGKAASFMNKGQLVPSDLIINLMGERLLEADCKNGYILDGFPRRVDQAEGLEKMLGDSKLDAVINIEVSEAKVVKRLSGRRQCSKCQDLYHVEFSPPKKDGVCDKCGGSLYQRDDDKEETILNRLDVYKKETAPLIGYYQKKGLLMNVNGSADSSKVFDEICSLIDKR